MIFKILIEFFMFLIYIFDQYRRKIVNLVFIKFFIWFELSNFFKIENYFNKQILINKIKII